MAAIRILGVFLRLGLTCFGGPTAHIAAFHEEFVRRRRWLDEAAFADLVALCLSLPGPASSQVGLAIGYLRGGHRGAALAWIGFTMPSAVIMALLAYGLALGQGDGAAWLHALKLAAVAIVAQAAWKMGRSLWTERRRMAIGMASAGLLLAFPVAGMQLAVIAAGAAAGKLLLADDARTNDGCAPTARPSQAGERRLGLLLITTFLLLLVLLPASRSMLAWPALEAVDSLYRVGALAFGSGHVILPLLHGEATAAGWMDSEAFLAGYGAAQALPGPLFTIAAFLGAKMDAFPNAPAGALTALLAIYAPSFLLVPGLLPFWSQLRERRGVRAALAGTNAAVVGLLIAALYDPLLVGSVRNGMDLAWALGALVLLAGFRWPPWLVVGLSVPAAEAAHRIAGMLAAGT